MAKVSVSRGWQEFLNNADVIIAAAVIAVVMIIIIHSHRCFLDILRRFPSLFRL